MRSRLRVRGSIGREVASCVIVAAAMAPGVASADDFSYAPPGELTPGSGEGRVDDKVYAPGMRFPMETGPAFANSQVWGVGGSEGPPGGQCDAANFSYPWRDNYCETRTWDMPLCPSGQGHQGQDIRAATCDKDVHWVVAAEDGTITNIGTYSVYLTTANGTRFDYLHMGSVQVSVGQDVKKGQQIGKVSNEFGGTPTTTHLHFNIRQNVDGIGSVYVPTYMSLIESYQALIGPVTGPPEGALDAADCASVRGWAQDPDAAEAAVTVQLAFGGPKGDAKATVIELPADRHRDDLCGKLGSCAHAFETALPLSLLDDADHPVHAYALDDAAGEPVELAGSPQSFACKLELPEGVRRHVVDAASFGAWKFSAFWDQATVDDGVLDDLPVGPDLPGEPLLVRADDGSPEVWLLDSGLKRHVGSPELAAAWSFDLGGVDERPADELDALDEGPPVRSRPFLVKGSGDAVYLMDSDLPVDAATGGVGAGFSGKATSEAEGQAGCGCRTGAPADLPGPAWLALAGLALALRRRTSPPNPPLPRGRGERGARMLRR